MQDNELKNLVDEFLYLVEVGSSSTAADESELAPLLEVVTLELLNQYVPTRTASLRGISMLQVCRRCAPPRAGRAW